MLTVLWPAAVGAVPILDPEAPLFPASAQRTLPAPSRLPPVRGVHLSGRAAGSAAERRRLIASLREAGLNAVVVAVKEYDGKVQVRGVPLAEELGAFAGEISDLRACVGEFKTAGLYTIARVTLFKDDLLARRRTDLAVRKPDGSVWTTNRGVAWVDPYRREVWDYNLAVASAAAAAGFDEIQFDYIRFPSDGPTALCRYSRKDHSPRAASQALSDFLAQARAALKPMGVKLSACLFGLTTSVDNGMGIGQHLGQLAREVDFISPMMYPSHYGQGVYGIEQPGREPYLTVRQGLQDATGKLGEESFRLRPYLQDFSHGQRYGPREVRAQILAAARSGVQSWILWNPKDRYTWQALTGDVSEEEP